MGWLISGIIFIFGLCVGSFLNVLIYRLPRSLPLTGRSFCPKCKKKISWYDNIPLVSFILLRGKCRSCHSPISIQYPLVEISTALLFLLVYYYFHTGLWFMVYGLWLMSALLVIFVADFRYQVVPDQITYPTTIIVFLFQFISNQSSTINHVFSALGAGLFFLSLHLLTRRRGMGMGDVKLAFLMGLVLGFPKIILALYLAFLTGAFVGVILILAKVKRFGEHIPFGPFLTSATLISLFWGEQILRWLTARFF